MWTYFVYEIALHIIPKKKKNGCTNPIKGDFEQLTLET